MKKNILAIFSVLFIIGAVKAADPETYRLNIRDFAELQVVDNLNVVHRCSADSAGMAVFTCTPNVVSHLMFTNNKNKLKIQINNDDNPVPASDFPTVTVYSNFITSVENSGDSTLTVESPAPGAKFKARIIGNGTLVASDIHSTVVEGSLDTGRGHLVMSGKANTVKLSNIGTGRIEAGGLSAESGSVKILGTGPVDCQVSGELTVKGLGSGKVYVKGNPNVKKRALGSVNVINVE